MRSFVMLGQVPPCASRRRQVHLNSLARQAVVCAPGGTDVDSIGPCFPTRDGWSESFNEVTVVPIAALVSFTYAGAGRYQ